MWLSPSGQVAHTTLDWRLCRTRIFSNVYSEDIDVKDLEKYFLASSQGQAPGFSPKNFITTALIFFFKMS